MYSLLMFLLVAYATLPALYYYNRSYLARHGKSAQRVETGAEIQDQPPELRPVKELPRSDAERANAAGVQETTEWEEMALLRARRRIKLYPKEVFLTFDDGPSSNNTTKILDILTSHNVRATFFTIGRSAAAHPEILLDESTKGMALVAHSYTHNYRLLYSSSAAFIEEFQTTNNIISQATGREPLLFTRWPGGSDNRVSSPKVKADIKSALKERGINYLDWNVDSTDASGTTVPADRIRDNVIKQLQDKPLAVILFHDSSPKVTTVEALPAIIQYLKEQGYVFRTFDEINVKEEEEMIRLGIMNK